MAVEAINNYGVGSANYSQYYDPYFLQAYQSPNYYQLQAQNNQQTGGNSTVTTTANPNFKGATAEIVNSNAESKKTNKVAKWVLGTLATAGTVFAAWKCHGKGVGEKWYSKISDGFKKYWDNGIDWVSKLKFNKTELDDPLERAWIAATHST